MNYTLYVIVDDFFRCNELRRFVSCFYPSQALKIEDAMSRGNGAEMSVAKKFPATWPWCYRPKQVQYPSFRMPSFGQAAL